MTEKPEEAVLVWVEGTSKEGVAVRGYLNHFERYRYCGITTDYASVMEKEEAIILIRANADKNPGLTFVIKHIA